MHKYKHIFYSIIVLNIQALLAPKLSIYGITPNFLVPYAITLTIGQKQNFCIPVLFFLGLGYDLLYPQLLGLNSFALILTSFAIDRWHPNINKTRFASVLLSLFLVHTIYYFLYQIYQFFNFNTNLSFVAYTGLSIVYNTVLTLIWVYIWAIVSRVKLQIDV